MQTTHIRSLAIEGVWKIQAMIMTIASWLCEEELCEEEEVLEGTFHMNNMGSNGYKKEMGMIQGVRVPFST